MSAPTVLLIGGSDSSGGAGIARDVATLTAFGVSAAVAISAVTAQTDARVTAIHYVPAQVLAAQITAACTARNIAAIKIGMLGSVAALQPVVAVLRHATCPSVLDPVLVSSSGTVLLEESALVELRTQLLPLVSVLTPNISEAAVLLKTSPATDESSMLVQARALLELGPAAVLMKSGHGAGAEAVDLLMTRGGRVERLVAVRLPTTLRGTGCMLASAIAAGLALQEPLLEACLRAKRYVTEQLQATLHS